MFLDRVMLLRCKQDIHEGGLLVARERCHAHLLRCEEAEREAVVEEVCKMGEGMTAGSSVNLELLGLKERLDPHLHSNLRVISPPFLFVLPPLVSWLLPPWLT